MNIYEFFITIPDRLYPWGGFMAYNARIIHCKIIYGYEFLCKDLVFYRAIFHFLGALLVLLFYFLIKKYFSKKVAFLAVIFFLSYLLFQELYLQPLIHDQILWKGISDLIIWFVPILIGFLFERKTKKTIRHFLKLHKLYFSFIKSDIGSLCAGAIDYLTLGITTYVFEIKLPLSIILGVCLGGFTYFIIAKLWVFKDAYRNWKGESWRFLITWFASLIFNTLGTTFLSLSGVHIFLSRLITSIVVSIFWNFPLNRFWVFKTKK